MGLKDRITRLEEKASCEQQAPDWQEYRDACERLNRYIKLSTDRLVGEQLSEEDLEYLEAYDKERRAQDIATLKSYRQAYDIRPNPEAGKRMYAYMNWVAKNRRRALDGF
jgi:hypothetical protein